MPTQLDRKLRMSFRLKFMTRIVQSIKPSWPKKVFQGGIVTACAVMLIIGVGFFQGPAVRYTEAAVESAYLNAERMNEFIKHQEVTYREGADKIPFTHTLGSFDDADVVMRSENIERWQHGNHSFAIVDPTLPDALPELRLNFENEGHVHVFKHQIRDCDEQADLLGESSNCVKERALTKEEKDARALLDSAHDLATLYTGVIGFAPEEDMELLEWVEDMEFIGVQKSKNNKRAIFLLKHTENLHSILSFDAKTGALQERSILVIAPEKEYEMTVVEYGVTDWISAEKAGEIFNPEAYSFEQIDLVPLY